MSLGSVLEPEARDPSIDWDHWCCSQGHAVKNSALYRSSRLADADSTREEPAASLRYACLELVQPRFRVCPFEHRSFYPVSMYSPAAVQSKQPPWLDRNARFSTMAISDRAQRSEQYMHVKASSTGMKGSSLVHDPAARTRYQWTCVVLALVLARWSLPLLQAYLSCFFSLNRHQCL